MEAGTLGGRVDIRREGEREIKEEEKGRGGEDREDKKGGRKGEREEEK